MGDVLRGRGMNKSPHVLSQKQAMAWTQMTLSALATSLREPVEFGEGTPTKKPVSTNEHVEEESRRYRPRVRRIPCTQRHGFSINASVLAVQPSQCP